MNKLEVGMYVRTIKGIVKIVGRVNDPTNYYYKFWKCDKFLELYDDTEYIHDEDIIGEPSFNIIDLIEIGDYVNGCYVTNRQAKHNEGLIMVPKRTGIIKCNAYFNQGNYNDCDFKWIEKEDIKSIVTKEQFERMKYEVK